MNVPLALLIVLWLALLAACRTGPAASGRIRAGDTTLEQAGPAAVPASAGREQTRRDTVVPPGVAVTAHADGSLTWTTVEPLAVSTTTTTEHATGPASFAPPAPPSPADQARGFGVRAFYLAALACGLAAGFALWRGYPLAALCLGGAAAGLPILANVVSSPAGVLWGAISVTAAVALAVGYKLTHRPAPGLSSQS